MRNVPRPAVILLGAMALAACAKDNDDQNIIIDNDVAANADIEAVPADESSDATAEELDNGAIEDNSAANNSL